MTFPKKCVRVFRSLLLTQTLDFIETVIKFSFVAAPPQLKRYLTFPPKYVHVFQSYFDFDKAVTKFSFAFIYSVMTHR